MANELTYQSEFTGQQMDAKFTAVGELTAALAALTAVVAQKYVKPTDGIPATDMDEDVQAALAKALTAVQSLADYYTKAEVDALLAAINAQEYVDVASLPTASASTMGKIYLVGPDGSGYYSYYISSYDGAAYSWVGPLGTTEISLANYATKAELSQLSQEVVDFSQETLEYGVITIDNPTTWSNRSYPGHYMLTVKPGEKYVIQGDALHFGYVAVLKERPTYDYGAQHAPSTAPVYSTAEGYTTLITLAKGAKVTLTIPDDGVCLYIKQSGGDMPTSVTRYGSKSYGLQIDALTDGLDALGKKTDIVFRTNGYIQIDNGLKTVNVHETLQVVVQGVTYAIQNGASFDISSGLDNAANVAKLVFNTDNLSLVLTESTLLTKYPMVAMLSKTGAAPYKILNVVSSPLLNVIKIDDHWVVPHVESRTPYTGERLQLPSFNVETYGDDVAGLPFNQSGVFYGNYGVFFSGNSGDVYIVDLTSRSILATLSIPSPGGTYHAPHCNTANFGLVMGSEKSICPLIYVSQWTGGYERACFVYDVQLDDDTFSIEQVQVINLASISSSIIGSGSCDFVVDSDNERLVAYAYQTAQSADEGTALMIAEFALPSLSDSEVILTDADVLHNCIGTNIPRRQDSFYMNGKIVLGSGLGTSELPAFINAVRIDTGHIVTKIPLHEIWTSKEPETLTPYGDKILFTAGANKIYKLDS